MSGKIVYFIILIILGGAFIRALFTDSNAIFDEIQQNVVVVDDGKVDSGNEGKLVLASGPMTCDNVFEFDELDLSYNTCYVEIEWQKQVDGDWQDQDTIKESVDAKIGDFTLPKDFFAGLGSIGYHRIELDGYTYDDEDYWYYNEDGDIRLKAKTTPLGDDYTVLAKQVGDHFEEYKLQNSNGVLKEFYHDKVTTMDELAKYVERGVNNSRIFLGLIFAIMLGIGVSSLKKKPTAKAEK